MGLPPPKTVDGRPCLPLGGIAVGSLSMRTNGAPPVFFVRATPAPTLLKPQSAVGILQNKLRPTTTDGLPQTNGLPKHRWRFRYLYPPLPPTRATPPPDYKRKCFFLPATRPSVVLPVLVKKLSSICGLTFPSLLTSFDPSKTTPFSPFPPPLS